MTPADLIALLILGYSVLFVIAALLPQKPLHEMSENEADAIAASILHEVGAVAAGEFKDQWRAARKIHVS